MLQSQDQKESCENIVPPKNNLGANANHSKWKKSPDSGSGDSFFSGLLRQLEVKYVTYPASCLTTVGAQSIVDYYYFIITVIGLLKACLQENGASELGPFSSQDFLSADFGCQTLGTQL